MDCSYQPELTLDEWAETLLASLEGRRYPLSGSIELTERCNLSCVHCYINQPAADKTTRARELSTDQWIDVIDQLADAGCLFLLLTGGEALLRPDFNDIFLHTRQRGMLVSLFSNGTLLTPETADILSVNRLNSLEITLYGATRETYEKVTGVPGSYARCLRGIELALERHIPTSLKSVLLTLNQQELEDMKALAEKLGVSFRYDGVLWPRLDGSHSPMPYQISEEDLLKLDTADTERFEKWSGVVDEFKGQLLRAGRVFTCGAAHRSFHIDASGSISPCMMVRKISYNLLELGFSGAWEKLGEIRNLTRTLHTPCEKCTVNALCSQCPGWSLAYNNDLETPYPSVCEIGKKRASQIVKN